MPVGVIPFPFGKCKICKDKATGVHYGVATCEGCKGFFKRSIPKSHKYKCFFGGQCEISPKNRNRCKSCRYKLCLHYGMSIDAVKMGRIPKTEKEKALAEAAMDHSSESSTSPVQSFSSPTEEHTEFPFGNKCNDKSKTFHVQNPFMDSALSQFNAPSTSMSEQSHFPMNERKLSMDHGFLSRTQRAEFHRHGDIAQSNVTPPDYFQSFQNHNRDLYQQATGSYSPFYREGRRSSVPCSMDIPSISAIPLSEKSNVPANSQSAHVPEHASNTMLFQSENANIQPPQNVFSSSVIDELIRHVLDSLSASPGLPQGRTNSISSCSSSVGCCNAMEDLNFSDNGSQAETALHTRSSFNGSIDNVKQSLDSSSWLSPDTSNSLPQDADDSSPEDTGDSLTQDAGSSLPQDTSDSLTQDAGSSLPIGSENIVNKSIPSDKSHESNQLISDTLARFEEPIKFLFDGLAFNKECYLKHISGEKILPSTGIEPEKLKGIWDELVAGVNIYNELIVGFAKKIPGFFNLTKADQERLTFNAYMEVWMMIHAQFLKGKESFVLLNGKEIFYSKSTMTKFLGAELVGLMFDFGAKFSQYNLSDHEIGILAAILLTNPEVENLEEREKAMVLNTHILDVFASMICKRPNSSRFALSLFQYMSVLKKISKLQTDVIFNFQLEFQDEVVKPDTGKE